MSEDIVVAFGSPARGQGSKLGISAERHWCRIRGFTHPAKVIDGVEFEDRIEVNTKTDNSRSTA